MPRGATATVRIALSPLLTSPHSPSLCAPVAGDSHLRALTNLTELNLSFTEVTRICRDWREGMPRLLNLRLSNTNITILSVSAAHSTDISTSVRLNKQFVSPQFSDLQYKRDNATLQHAEGPSVELYNARVTTIDYSAADELRARDVPTARVTVKLSVPLVCDCRLFRALRALRREPKHANLGGTLMCAARPDGAPARALLQVPLDDLMCRSEPKVCPDLPPGCACWHREQGEMGRLLWRVRVNCEGAGLAEMPPLPALNGSDVEWDLRLARNNISTLDKLPSGLLVSLTWGFNKLDLRNNSVSRVSARAATALGRAVAVKLSGNPLACDCDAMPLLNAVAALHAGRGELDAALCEDGRALLDDGDGRFACPEGGGLSVLLVATLGTLLGALALATLAAGSALVRPAQRVRLKGVLLRWGWLPRSAEPADGRRFDVFVAFAHMDAEFVRELTVRLESGAHALRLCLHERDWAPGEFIGAQVAASVRNARRTLVVVSRHFLLSEWTRAEFREAQAAGARDGTPRLVVVLLEEPDALPLDRELRRYLATNTYLRSNHPRFWERLRDALAAPAPGPTTLAIPKPDPTTLTIPIPVTAAGSAPAHALSMGADKTPVGGSPCRNKPVGGLPCRNTPVGGSPGGLADGAHVAPTPA
ncbi:Toll receptor [Operophtera brumata]|uniref:Toll receptor n=1 Tax=Operophtera brumata TaxID=104452 RepID=A0A0L7LPX8_OPEBR|nr:Toll receptor [Operophtera brumata]